MLSTRARNVLTAAGCDLTDTPGSVAKVRSAIANGVQWRNCGRKTWRELETWAEGHLSVQANNVFEELVERGAVAVLLARGYTVSREFSKGAT